jgi:hypothetical protein
MRKIILVIAFILLGSTLCFADKPTSYTSVSDVKAIMNFNVPKNVQNKLYYIPIYLKITGIATTSDGGERAVTIEEEVGELSETVNTPNTIHTLLSANYLQEAYADFYSEALDQTVPSE